jgi:hypothetical protein
VEKRKKGDRMKVETLLQSEEFTLVNKNIEEDKLEQEIQSGYAGDLLSWVMANAGDNCAWITIQTHVNIIAIASLLEMSCIIIAENAKIEADTLKKATDEGVPVISTELNSYQTALVLGQQGVL